VVEAALGCSFRLSAAEQQLQSAASGEVLLRRGRHLAREAKFAREDGVRAARCYKRISRRAGADIDDWYAAPCLDRHCDVRTRTVAPTASTAT
jgi:hypothetical protein